MVIRALPVRAPAGPVADMGYWPSYANADPQHRFLYLKWLAGGKRELPPLEGLLFLYFYGLERRILLDGQDWGVALREVVRLLQLDIPRRGTREGSSFRHYAGNLLWFLLAYQPKRFSPRSLATISHVTEGFTDDHAVALANWFALQGQRVPAAHAWLFARIDHRSKGHALARRAGERFTQLFGVRLTKAFPNGLLVEQKPQQRTFSYRPATSALGEAKFSTQSWAIASGDATRLVELWNECVGDLRKSERARAGRKGDTVTVAEWEALPAELKAGVEHPLQEPLESVLAEASSAGDMVGDIARVTAGQLAGLLEIARRDKLSKSQSEKLAAAFEQAGACIEPDVRVLGGSYSWHEKLSVFTIDEDVTAHGRSFPAAACVLQFGMAIALADGKAHDSELAHLAGHLDGAFHLSPLDRRRLDALRIAWMDRGDDLLKLGKKMVERLGREQRESLGRFLVVLAALEGQIGRDELATLRRAFRSLSLSPELLEQAIAGCCPAADDGLAVVQQRTVETDAGEMIPPVASVKLDMNAVEALIRETKAVSAALAAAMSDDSGAPMGGADAATQPAPTMTAATPDADMNSAALPEPLAGLVSALRAKTEWAREDAEQLARQHGLMLNGAIEAINEWSIDALGTPVVDDCGDRLAVQG